MSSGSFSFEVADCLGGRSRRSLGGLLRVDMLRWLGSDAGGCGRFGWGAGLRERDSWKILLDLVCTSHLDRDQHTKSSRVLLDISFLSIGEIMLAPVDIPGAD